MKHNGFAMRSVGLKSGSFQSSTNGSRNFVFVFLNYLTKTSKRSFGGIEAKSSQLLPKPALRIAFVGTRFYFIFFINPPQAQPVCPL